MMDGLYLLLVNVDIVVIIGNLDVIAIVVVGTCKVVLIVVLLVIEDGDEDVSIGFSVVVSMVLDETGICVINVVMLLALLFGIVGDGVVVMGVAVVDVDDDDDDDKVVVVVVEFCCCSSIIDGFGIIVVAVRIHPSCIIVPGATLFVVFTVVVFAFECGSRTLLVVDATEMAVVDVGDRVVTVMGLSIFSSSMIVVVVVAGANVVMIDSSTEIISSDCD